MIAADYVKRTVPLKLGIFLFQTNWLKMAQGDFFLFFFWPNSAQILIIGVQFLRDPITRGAPPLVVESLKYFTLIFRFRGNFSAKTRY